MMTEAAMTGTGIVPTMEIGNGNNNDSWGGAGGGWIWIILIFALLGGGGLWGNNLNRDGVVGSTANALNADFLYTQQKIDNLTSSLIGQTTALNQTMNSGFNSVNMGLCELGHRVDTGFCGVNRNIDQVRFEGAQNTCVIKDAINGSTQAIKDLINSNTMQDLRDRNVELASALNNSQQTATIVNALRPYPTPSYLTSPPGLPFGVPAVFGNDGCVGYC